MCNQAVSHFISNTYLSVFFESEHTVVHESTEKVHQVLCRNELPLSTKPDNKPQAPINVSRSNIDYSNTDETTFKAAFSWQVTRQDYPNIKMRFKYVPDRESINYKNDVPQIDSGWNWFIYKAIIAAIRVHKDIEAFKTDEKHNDYINIYRSYAQILLDRFLEKNPAYKDLKYRSTHHALILQAIATTIKANEENGIKNKYFAICLNDNQSASLTKDLKQMERLFLKGIEWNTVLSLSEPMTKFLMK